MDITYIHKQFLACTLCRYALPSNSSILLSISGGQDSLSLLKLIIDSQPYSKWEVGLVYFDHQLRLDSRLNLQQILNICKITNMKSYIYENKSISSFELQSREWRYRTLFHIASTYNYSKIITAHTLTDLSETFFQRIFRGSNIDSIIGISFSTQISTTTSIIRPLLEIQRAETSWLSKKFCLPLWSDYTNYVCKHTRNRLREELVPYLQQYFQPKINYKIQSLLKNTKLDIEYLQKAAIKLYFLVKHPSFVAINYSLLFNQPRALQYRVIKLFFKHNLNTTITIREIDKIINNTGEKSLKINVIYNLKMRLLSYNYWLYILAA